MRPWTIVNSCYLLVAILLVLLIWAIITPCDAAAQGVSKRAPGPRPTCPSTQCKCKGKRKVRVDCRDLEGLVPNFTYSDALFKEVRLVGQSITTVPNGSFTATRTILLDLSHNLLGTEPGSVSPGAFTGQGDSLRELILSANGLTTIPELSLSVLNNLRVLRLEDNAITSINPRAFINNTDLQELYLFNNRIYNLHTESFYGLDQLKYLKLMGNNIHQIPEGVFRQLKRLYSLELSLNFIETIPKDTFRGLWHLVYLELQDNDITRVHRRTFRGLRRLKYFKLDGNALTSVGDKTFFPIRKLRYLSLDIVHIQDLNPKIFKGLHKLKVLVLGEVNSSALSEGIFEPLKSVEYMTIFNRTGQFESLSDHVFPPDMDIKKVELSITDFCSCKCKLPWIKGLTSRGMYVTGSCGSRTCNCLDKSLHRDQKKMRRKNKNKQGN